VRVAEILSDGLGSEAVERRLPYIEGMRMVGDG